MYEVIFVVGCFADEVFLSFVIALKEVSIVGGGMSTSPILQVCFPERNVVGDEDYSFTLSSFSVSVAATGVSVSVAATGLTFICGLGAREFVHRVNRI